MGISKYRRNGRKREKFYFNHVWGEEFILGSFSFEMSKGELNEDLIFRESYMSLDVHLLEKYVFCEKLSSFITLDIYYLT